ncbi:MAG: 5-(carboxyamino)imidazole ribonucleotide mutase [Chlamydiae bacterium CG10_big_fil_rev_8_21_14_0_10_35_9]|nr:MAG: 5-(carboxyamino)imidazole ribonucleotide mutase [Chlamydiae bacterium CG10_big_fil_rev_8_21_14_0_10_35_9]
MGEAAALVSIAMGSYSDMRVIESSIKILQELEIGYEVKIVSAHRTPNRLYSYAQSAKSKGIQVIIAAAGGAAHLPGMIASMTTIPVLGVPIDSKHLKGIDSLLSIVQMPGGVPVGTLAIGAPGAKNAALLAASILALNNRNIAEKLDIFRDRQTQSILEEPEAYESYQAR